MDPLEEYIRKKLAKRKEENAFRILKISHPDHIDFFSNDYLGIARDFRSVNNSLSSGSTGSRLLGGNSIVHEETEKFLADFHHSESALLFNSGYAANTGLFSSLLEKGDTYIYDELCHASIRDGIRLNQATSWSFLHNDLSDLEKKLKSAKGKKVVITESVFSMDGDLAPLKKMVELCEIHDAKLIVDEAHAVGIFGEKGEGRVVEENLSGKIYATIITFGKAIGAHGAAVLGDSSLCNYLINYSRPFIYTTALPPESVRHIRNHYEFFSANLNRKKRLNDLIVYYKKKAAGSVVQTGSGDSPIQTIIIPGNDEVKNLSRQLLNNKLDVRPILSPTVPPGKERLRICLHSFNTESEVDLLIEAIHGH